MEGQGKKSCITQDPSSWFFHCIEYSQLFVVDFVFKVASTYYHINIHGESLSS